MLSFTGVGSAAKLERVGAGVLTVITMMMVLCGGGLNRVRLIPALRTGGVDPGMAESKANPKQTCRLSTPFPTSPICPKPQIRQGAPRPPTQQVNLGSGSGDGV